MANSDYIIMPGTAAFASTAVLAAPMDAVDDFVYFRSLQLAAGVAPAVGDGVMIGEEIVRIDEIGPNYITAARGCADTIPQEHPLGTRIWFFRQSVGTDGRAYAPSETIGVKMLPRTASQPPIAVSKAPPIQLTFNQRFARPYPPGKVMVNDVAWPGIATLEEDEGELVFSWAHRNRIVQADQLVSHGEDGVEPEEGTTYRLQFYNKDDELVSEETGITGDSFAYNMASAIADYGIPSGGASVQAYAVLTAMRDGLESWQSYRIDFAVIPVQPYGLGYRLGESLGGIEP
jgi:hypothetical protein